jgi:hypothetical protein
MFAWQQLKTATEKLCFLWGQCWDVISETFSEYTYAICVIRTLDKAKTINKKKPILSSEKMLHKDYDRKGSDARNPSPSNYRRRYNRPRGLAVVNCRVCDLAVALELLVAAIRKCSINLITNPNTVYSHTHKNATISKAKICSKPNGKRLQGRPRKRRFL